MWRTVRSLRKASSTNSWVTRDLPVCLRDDHRHGGHVDSAKAGETREVPRALVGVLELGIAPVPLEPAVPVRLRVVHEPVPLLEGKWNRTRDPSRPRGASRPSCAHVPLEEIETLVRRRVNRPGCPLRRRTPRRPPSVPWEASHGTSTACRGTAVSFRRYRQYRCGDTGLRS